MKRNVDQLCIKLNVKTPESPNIHFFIKMNEPFPHSTIVFGTIE